ncbi:hypothetical protein D7S86_26730 [Pararobbsia silviterrae]|uniref:DUF3108 domain-containing protein n=1 Tax=Pararobbsia silviterrae TaxID=1792498 RepID=A0A494XBY3_9BURK|nr:hypothetical protein D7S86_26730 [Pararobbsia silviterrae]
MKKQTVSALACAWSLAAATAALAQPVPLTTAQAPKFVPGDSWTYAISDPRQPSRTFSFVQTVDTVNGDTIGVTISNLSGTMPASFDANGNLTSNGNKQYLPSDGKLKFPMSAGSTWTSNFTTRTSNGDATTTLNAKVTGVDSIETTAGTFQAFRIESTGNVSAPNGKYSFTETDWYAPAAKRIVKFQFSGAAADGSTFGTQAVLQTMEIKQQ